MGCRQLSGVYSDFCLGPSFYQRSRAGVALSCCSMMLP